MNDYGEIQQEDLAHRFVIGIDLGTTNSAVAYVDLSEGAETQARRPIRLFELPQLIGPGELSARPVLPSFLYLPGDYDLPPESTALPWDPDRSYVVGEFAREQGARVPGRLVSSAKSWLSHAQVDRTAPILPWGAKDEVAKVSPVAASMRYLQHVREAWDARMGVDGDGTVAEKLFDAQLVILTVPASFDEVARELTLTAAREAGLAHAILLEEPLAAFYAWLARHEADWQGRMHDGQIILVCDVGGGTSDFSLVGVRAGALGLRFDRLAVGEHLMLGGDNMDYTLGRHLESLLFGAPGKLDAQRWHQLVHQCRQAKEMLLDDHGAAQVVDVTVLGVGGQLISATRKGSLAKDEVERLILDGFFPAVASTDRPLETRRSGLTELGLPYVQDPAITRHLAAFWQRFEALLRAETGRDEVYPDFILFNGGTLSPASVRRRLLHVVRDWFVALAGPDWAPSELINPHPELAVARGAAYYGLVRLGKGVRIGSGSPRSYYVSVQADLAAVTDAAKTAVCLVPRGTEEGFDVQLSALDFEALTNQPVAFQLFTSSTRLGDRLGDVVQLAPHEISELPPIQTVLRYGRKGTAQQLPVQLAVHLTEVGTLEIFCQSRQTNHRWQLQFDVRQTGEVNADVQVVEETIDEAAIDEVRALIHATFAAAGERPPAQLRRDVEEILDMPKERWPTPLIRALADSLLDESNGRTRSAEHEARWLNLLGFCLRPGFGDPVDEWRLKRVWKIYFEGVTFPRQTQNRTEWWIFWRRVAGGLKAGQQLELYQQVRAYVLPARRRKSKAGQGMPKSVGGGELLEIWLMLANFERLSPEIKVELGSLLLGSVEGAALKARELWALSRLGARTAIYGPLDRLAPPAAATAWIQALLALDLTPSASMAQALVLLARETGDRARDVPDDQRAAVAEWLDQLPHPERWLDLLQNPARELRQEEQEWIFGESLPTGLVLQTLDI